MGLRRHAGIGGLVFVGLVVITNLAQGAAGRPFGDSSDESYLTDYLEHYTDATWLPTLLGFVTPAIWAALAVFAVGMAIRLAGVSWQGAGAAWSLVALVGITMQNSIFPVVVAMDVAQFRIVSDGAAIDRVVHEAHEVLFALNSASLAIALLGFGMAMRHRGLGPQWLPRLGLGAATLLAISVVNIGLDPASSVIDLLGLLGFLSWLAFIATSSIWLLRHPQNDDTAVPAAVRAAPGGRITTQVSEPT